MLEAATVRMLDPSPGDAMVDGEKPTVIPAGAPVTFQVIAE